MLSLCCAKTRTAAITTVVSIGIIFVFSHLLCSQKAITADDATNMAKRLQSGAFDFNDFLAQTQMMRNVGGMSSVMKMIPGTSVFVCVFI